MLSVLRPTSRWRLACSSSALPSITGGATGAAAVARVPRGRLDLKFAVLLLRSSYETVDELDFVAMDRFQVTAWKRRAAEQEGYKQLLAPLTFLQGDLSDPFYFDFMTFVQLLVVGELMRSGEQVFVEATGADGEQRTVRRDQRLADNSLLPAEYGRRVGELIFSRLRDGFEEEVFGAPPACAVLRDWACTVDGVRGLLHVFESRGFAFSARLVDADEGARRLHIKVDGAATLFATAELAARKSSPPPALLEYTLQAFMRACGWTEARMSTRSSRSSLDIEVQL